MEIPGPYIRLFKIDESKNLKQNRCEYVSLTEFIGKAMFVSMYIPTRQVILLSTSNEWSQASSVNGLTVLVIYTSLFG